MRRLSRHHRGPSLPLLLSRNSQRKIWADQILSHEVVWRPLDGRRSEIEAGTIDTGNHADRATEPTESRGLISLHLGHRNIHPYSTFREDRYARRTIFRLQ